MLREIEIIWRKQLRGTFEAQRFAQSGVELLGNGIKFFLGECTQGGSLGQILPQQAIGVFVNRLRKGSMVSGLYVWSSVLSYSLVRLARLDSV